MRLKLFIQTFFLPLPSTTQSQTSSSYSPKKNEPSLEDSSKSDSEKDIGDSDFTDVVEEKSPYFPNQKDINDLIRDLGLTKSNAELLTFWLKQWN